MPSPEKFRETLQEYEVSQEVIREIDDGFEELVSASPKSKKTAYFNRALEIMKKELGIEKTKEIFEANGCCRTGARLKASKEFARINAGITLEEKLEKIRKASYMNMGSPLLNEHKEVVVHAVSYRIEGKYLCACPTISKQPNQTKSKDYCYCCAGHFKFHYEIMLGCKLKTEEIVSSPLNSEGNDPCVIRYSIVE